MSSLCVIFLLTLIANFEAKRKNHLKRKIQHEKPLSYHRRTLWPSSYSRRPSWSWDPFEHPAVDTVSSDRSFDRNNMDLQLRDLSFNDHGDLNYRLDVIGFRPEELKVELNANEIVVEGEHREQNRNETRRNTFTRRVLIPDSIRKDSIKCDLDANGHLRITGQNAKNGAGGVQPIPVHWAK